MEPVARQDHNFTYKGPTPEIGDLSCEVEGKSTKAHFKPNEEEIEVLRSGGHVELEILGHPIPPVRLGAVKSVPPPEPEEEAEEPEEEGEAGG